IANNFANGVGRDVNGVFTSRGHNLIGVIDGSSGWPFMIINGGISGTIDLLGTAINPLDPKLGALANNGGPTLTHALLASSPAIDGGDTDGAPATDQRGVSRPRDGDFNGTRIVDIGAFER